MSAITPSTNVKLLKLPLELDNENQLTFSSVSTQYNYFNSLPSLAANNFTYQRKDGVIRFPGCIDDLLQYNYVMYQNSAFGNKWFYAYIDKMSFVSPEMTDISIRTDPFQTWQFDITYLDSFVEREHVDDDTIGAHTVPEGLETGEYIINEDVAEIDLQPGETETNVTLICFAVSDFPDGTGALNPGFGDDPIGRIDGGVYNGLSILAVLSANDANELIRCYDRAQKGDAIVSIFHLPTASLATRWSGVNHTDTDGRTITIFQLVGDTYDAFEVGSIQLTHSTSINGYIPKNNKLYTHPFSYFYMTNNAGGQTAYRWEDFASTPSFTAVGTVTQGMSIRCYPTNYKNQTGKECYEYGLIGQKFPVCGWTTDSYINWLTQNGLNTVVQGGLSVLNSLGSAASLMAAGGGLSKENFTSPIMGANSLIGGLSGVVNSIHELESHKRMPDQAKGDITSGDVNMGMHKMGFSFYRMTIRYEYAKIIDDFFSMYGYKVNSVKTPNITGRRNWNYVKTIRGKIHGYIPKEDLNTISGMLDNGVTFWHSPSTFLDYSQTNDII